MTHRDKKLGAKPKPKSAKKSFDALEFKRRAQARLYKATKGMTHAEEIAYLERLAEEGPLGDWWRSLKKSTSVVREKPSGPRGTA